MDEIKINDKISYIASSENPLSAEIGIIRDKNLLLCGSILEERNEVLLCFK